ncbi:hypothetical protein [Haloarcula onubensis]|uniref:Uncharacterized protein n=1 Tax=Haloarcula onubensis TaxID=2950539 RepID=A0ABU2FPE5_9EURY|nr:hypothetical protein [Halomicroarcula sp. S3CR25-11]MDS0282625.1 hypothetical protein [Halomicroarcula sp. S3CR25-11]
MRPRQLPLVGHVRDAGADDGVFDTLLLVGPLVVVVVALVHRNAFTEALVLAYLTAFVGYILYRGLR